MFAFLVFQRASGIMLEGTQLAAPVQVAVCGVAFVVLICSTVPTGVVEATCSHRYSC